MSFLKISVASAATLLSFAPSALAGFDATASNNVAVYWGQNSAGTAESQQRLSYYCADTSHNIIPLAFLNGINTPATNFANAGDNCTAFAGSTLLDCPQIEEDIKSCQTDYGKTILISLGGMTYSEGGFADEASAQAGADAVWGLFGSDTSYENRPFGSAVVDGFDFDFESATTNLLPFARRLKANIDGDASRTYYLTAAPQCPYPDAAMTDVIDGDVPLDFLMIQFYNNYCSVASFVEGQEPNPDNGFNLATWDDWAKTGSANPDVKILVGAPGSTGAAGSGYVAADKLAAVLEYSKQFSSFGGAMVWDMSQVWSNDGFCK
ncbi:putative glycoside hydrolase family 18 protein [Eutypa lata UCREL1]|uniref:chitinase n=1 Tax=Eutypa lata (strain UCR-EL1) TaxID=1287681 RepID=M7TXL5_EUTLA|nr:putative glycoside hydrolase family 18 protein [Eutypa lata UCREL1]